ncbi:hypothetical protein PSHT_03041 [Puccinia striiformis]|uniref:Uncharacterized protein n=1 Tax=Puccinia striiformis TaxID=27350 RepID=A0A2S4WGJ6_9BASI|nr:hypothetical protein PSHT_03041 [Puccinia striiformis]
MAFTFNCPCLCWPARRKHDQQQHQQEGEQQLINSHSEAEANERTPLISNALQVTPSPTLPVVDTVQQQADEAAANRIVSQTVRCLVDVYSQAPFSHLKIRQPIPTSSDLSTDLPHTPVGTSSAWRAYDPPRCPPVSTEASRYQLSTPSNFQSTSGHHYANQTAASKRSFHSLKTIINHQDRSRSEEHDTRLSASLLDEQHHNGPLPRLSSSSTLPGSTHETSNQSSSQGHSRGNSIAPTSCSTQFDTIRTFQTARDHHHLSNGDQDENDEEDLTVTAGFPIANLSNINQQQPTLPPAQLTSKPDFAARLWDQPDIPTSNPSEEESPKSQSDQTSCQTENTDHHTNPLTDDPKKLAKLISSGFKLKDTGPILVEL